MLHVAIKHASGMYAMDDGTSLYCKLGVERDAPRNSKECLTRKYKLKTDSSKVSRGMVTWGKEFDLAVAPHKKVLVIKVRKIGFSVMKLRRKIEVCLSSSRARARRGSHSPPSPLIHPRPRAGIFWQHGVLSSPIEPAPPFALPFLLPVLHPTLSLRLHCGVCSHTRSSRSSPIPVLLALNARHPSHSTCHTTLFTPTLFTPALLPGWRGHHQ